MASGHLFVVRADLRDLACDAWALPCDQALDVSSWWHDGPRSPLRTVATEPQGDRVHVKLPPPRGWSSSARGRRVMRLPSSGADPGPLVWLLNTGGDGTTPVEWYLK